MDNNETYNYEDYQDLGGDDLSTTSFADGDLTSGASTGAAAASASSVILVLVFLILIFVAKIKLFIKAGREWWKAIIPVYRDYCTFQIARMPGWLALLPALEILLVIIMAISGAGALMTGATAAAGFAAILLPVIWIVSAVFYIANIVLCFKMSKAFGHGIGFGFGLLLLSPIFYMILAFGKSEYEYDDYDAGSAGDGNDDGGFGGYDNSFNDGGTPAGTPDGTAGGGYQNMQADYSQYAQPDYSQYNQPQDYQNQGYGQYGQAQDYGQPGQPSQPAQYDNNGLASATLPQNQQTPSYNDFYSQSTGGMQPTTDSYSQGTNGMQSAPDSYGQGMTQPDAGGYNAYGYQQPQMPQGQYNVPYGSQGGYANGYNGYANGFDNGSNSNQQ